MQRQQQRGDKGTEVAIYNTNFFFESYLTKGVRAENVCESEFPFELK